MIPLGLAKDAGRVHAGVEVFGSASRRRRYTGRNRTGTAKDGWCETGRDPEHSSGAGIAISVSKRRRGALVL